MHEESRSKSELIAEIKELRRQLEAASPDNINIDTPEGLAPEIMDQAFTHIYKQSNDAILILKNNVVIDCNHRTLEMFGMKDKSEVYSKTAIDFSPEKQPDGRNSIELAMEYIEIIRREKSYSFDWIFIDSEGTEFPARMQISVLDSNDGAEYQVLTINNRSHAVEQEQLISYFEHLVDSSSDAIIGVDIGGAITTWNSGAQRIFDIPREQAIGVEASEIFAPEYQPQMKLFVKRAAAGDYIENCEAAKDISGRRVHLSVSISPVMRNSVDKQGVAIIARDVTSQKKSEKKLRESEKRFRMLVENAFDGIYLLHHKRYEYINPRFSEITGYSYQEVTDPDFDYNLLLTDESRVMMEKRYKARIKDEDIPSRYELKIRHKSGREVYIDVTTVSIAKPGDVYVLGIIRDVTDRVAAMQALDKTNRLFRIAFQTTPDAISITRLSDGVYVDINKGFEELSGYKRDEIVDKSSLEINIWNNPDDRWKMADQIKQKGNVVNFQAEFKTKTRIIIGLMSANIIELDGVQHILSITRDITDKIRAEKQLRQSEERFRLITDNMKDMVCMHKPDGEYIYCSPSVYEVLGYSPTELKKKKVFELIHPDDLGSDSEIFAGHDGTMRRKEFRIRRSNSEYIWVEMLSQPISDPMTGDMRFIVSSARDISERIEAEKLLQYSEEQYRTLFEKMLNGFVIMNVIYDEVGAPQDYRFVKINQAVTEITGLKTEDILGKRLLEIFPELGHNWLEMLKKVAISGEAIREEKYSKMLDKHFELVMFVSRQGQLGLLFSDITERKHYEERIKSLNKDLEQRVAERTRQVEDTLLELENENEERKRAQNELISVNEKLEKSRRKVIEEANKLIEINSKLSESEQYLLEANTAKDKFFTIIAHDLKNPLQALLLTVNLLLRSHRMMDEEELEGKIFRVFHASRSLADLLDNLLQWARSQTGRIEYSPEPLDLEDVFSRNHNIVSDFAERKEIKMTVRNIGAANAYADYNLLNTILRNLLTNAIKFTEQGGHVTLMSRENVKTVEISVTDSGKGIEPGIIEKIFTTDKHYTTPGTSDESGTGLGLILCREFVRMHGGDLKIESRPGEGSRFYFEIPKA